MNITTQGVQNQRTLTRRRFVGATVALAAAPAVNAQQDDVLSIGVARESLAALCADMLALRSWWAHYSPTLRDIDRRMAAEINDTFVDGAGTARLLARCANLDMPDLTGYAWGRATQSVRFVAVAP